MRSWEERDSGHPVPGRAGDPHEAQWLPPSEWSMEVGSVAARLRVAPARVLLLDYDGTLVPFAQTPDLACPDDELLALLRALGASPGTDVHVVSGRSRQSLEQWLGAL